MNKAYKFRLYPNKEQEKVFNETLETCRRLYNHFLWERNTIFEKEKAASLPKEERTRFNKYTQQYKLPEMKKENHYLKTAPAIVLVEVPQRVHTSFKNFFRRVKNGDEKPGYPKFKKYHEYSSFTYSGSQTFSFREGKLYLGKIGLVKIKVHREIPENSNLKICTIIREIDKWYASITIEYENELVKPKLDSSKAIGIDLGINYLAALSTGEFFENPQWLRQYEKRLAQLHRNHSRKKKGSENKRKSAVEIARLHKRILNKKKDYYHKVTTNIVDRFDYIIFEDLKIKNMVKNKYLAKSISDVSWYMFRLMVENKAKEKGKVVVLIDPKYTSQNCSNCGVKVVKSLAVRTHKCPECGLVLDRDLNAAINILNKGLEKLRSSIDNTVGSTGSASGEVSEETRGRRNDTKRTGSPTTIVARPQRNRINNFLMDKGSSTTIVARPHNLHGDSSTNIYRSPTTKYRDHSLIRTFSPYILGDKKKVQAGKTDIQTNTIQHIIIELFLIRQQPFERFTYQDVQEVLEQRFSPRAFDIRSIRLNMNFLLDYAFPYKLVKETYYPKGSRGLRTEFLLTARIKKIDNGAE